MSVAALWDELNDEEDFLGDPLSTSAGGSPAGGTPFLPGVLDSAYLMVEAAFGADLTSAEPQSWNWFDITADVRQADGGTVAVTPVGRADEASQSQPAGCAFQLDNTSGAYTANHPGSPWFPFVRRNTPIRVRLYVAGTWSTRFQGYANGWVPSWDTSCNLAVVAVSASGVLRRLNQGKTPLRSALYRAIINSGPVAYWPFEDGKFATIPANAISGSTGMFLKYGPIQFAAQAGPAGSDNLPQCSSGVRVSGPLPASSATSWRVDFVARSTATGVLQPSDIDVQFFSSGDLPYWEFVSQNVADGGLRIYVGPNYNAGGATEYDTGLACADGSWHWFSIRATQNGADISVTAYVDTSSYSFTITGKTLRPLSTILAISIAPNDTASIGHLAIWQPTSTVDVYSPSIGWAGEAATTRIARLSSEQGASIAITGTSNVAMGPQSVDTYLGLVRECEATDDGLLVDGQGPGLAYIARTSRYNAATTLSLDMAADPPQVDDPFTPADDDQRNRNSVTVSRKNGSTATVEDNTGPLGTDTIGTYDTQVTVNTATDDVLDDRAGWEVHKGTIQGFRYPSLALDLMAAPALAPAWLATPLASRIDVLNVASKATQHPPGTVSLLLEGYGETLAPFGWTVSANASPYDPWRVAVIEGAGDTAWRVDSGASVIFRAYAVGDTLIKVSVNDGYLWSTSVGDYPVDIDAGGIQVTVTAVAGSSSPQNFTVAPLVYGIPDSTVVKLWRPPTIAL